VDGYPDYYIIDAEGKLVLADCANRSVEQALDALLK
jgi:leucyl aminopeptidase